MSNQVQIKLVQEHFIITQNPEDLSIQSKEHEGQYIIRMPCLNAQKIFDFFQMTPCTENNEFKTAFKQQLHRIINECQMLLNSDFLQLKDDFQKSRCAAQRQEEGKDEDEEECEDDSQYESEGDNIDYSNLEEDLKKVIEEWQQLQSYKDIEQTHKFQKYCDDHFYGLNKNDTKEARKFEHTLGRIMSFNEIIHYFHWKVTEQKEPLSAKQKHFFECVKSIVRQNSIIDDLLLESEKLDQNNQNNQSN